MKCYIGFFLFNRAPGAHVAPLSQERADYFCHRFDLIWFAIARLCSTTMTIVFLSIYKMFHFGSYFLFVCLFCSLMCCTAVCSRSLRCLAVLRCCHCVHDGKFRTTNGLTRIVLSRIYVYIYIEHHWNWWCCRVNISFGRKQLGSIGMSRIIISFFSLSPKNIRVSRKLF